MSISYLLTLEKTGKIKVFHYLHQEFLRQQHDSLVWTRLDYVFGH